MLFALPLSQLFRKIDRTFKVPTRILIFEHDLFWKPKLKDRFRLGKNKHFYSWNSKFEVPVSWNLIDFDSVKTSIPIPVIINFRFPFHGRLIDFDPVSWTFDRFRLGKNKHSYSWNSKFRVPVSWTFDRFRLRKNQKIIKTFETKWSIFNSIFFEMFEREWKLTKLYKHFYSQKSKKHQNVENFWFFLEQKKTILRKDIWKSITFERHQTICRFSFFCCFQSTNRQRLVLMIKSLIFPGTSWFKNGQGFLNFANLQKRKNIFSRQQYDFYNFDQKSSK